MALIGWYSQLAKAHAAVLGLALAVFCMWLFSPVCTPGIMAALQVGGALLLSCFSEGHGGQSCCIGAFVGASTLSAAGDVLLAAAPAGLCVVSCLLPPVAKHTLVGVVLDVWLRHSKAEQARCCIPSILTPHNLPCRALWPLMSPKWQCLLHLQVSTIAVGILGRVPQVILNFSRGDAGVLSASSCAMNLAGNLARVFTSMVLTGDALVLGGAVMMALLNGTLLQQALATKARHHRKHGTQLA